jgi:predicted metal-dependent phosphotriesterase family hydrolase
VLESSGVDLGLVVLHVSQDVVPYLRDHGVSDDQLDAMLVSTPARILAGG